MKSLITLAAVCVVAVAGVTALRAQVAYGVGVTVAALSQNVQQAGSDLQNLIKTDSLAYKDLASVLGVGLRGHLKIGLGPFRLMGNAAYVFFQSSDVTLQQIGVSGDTATGTFNVGTSVIPFAAGLELPVGAGPFHGYINALGMYSLFKRTYATVSGTQGGFAGGSISNQTASDNEAGLALGAGAEFGLFGLWFNTGAHYSLTNLFTKGTGEKPVNYAELEITLFLGDLSNGN